MLESKAYVYEMPRQDVLWMKPSGSAVVEYLSRRNVGDLVPCHGGRACYNNDCQIAMS